MPVLRPLFPKTSAISFSDFRSSGKSPVANGRDTSRKNRIRITGKASVPAFALAIHSIPRGPPEGASAEHRSTRTRRLATVRERRRAEIKAP
jgi:hypothetical protein